MAVGDSFTFGRGVRYPHVWTSLLEEALQKDGVDTAVDNRGLVGLNVGHILTLVERETNEKTYPLVIYGFVLNDFGLAGPAIVGQDFIDFNNGGYRYSWLRNTCRLYNFIADRLERRRLHNQTTQAYLEAFRGPRAEAGMKTLARLNDLVRERGGRLVVVIFPLLTDFSDYPFAEIHEKLGRFCQSRGIACLDLFGAFSQHRAQDLWVHPVDHHPNDVAHAAAAREIHQYLRKNSLIPVDNQSK